jgi:3-hydroxypropanoate dehydrogenase
MLDHAQSTLDDTALDLIFRKARTHNGWQDRPVPESLLRQVFADAIMGPTVFNSQPLRVSFLTTPAAKARLKPILSEGNRDKTMQAPVVALFAYDLHFYEFMPKTTPHLVKNMEKYAADPEAQLEMLLRSASLQAAYFMISARAHGLDCGPMSGFDNAKVDALFFADEPRHRSNFICAIGYGDPASIFERSPRPEFDAFNRID